MPAKSKAQQRFMGMVHSAQKGGKAASPEVAKTAKSIKKKDAKDFASTSHKGLPGHVDESQLSVPEKHQLKVARQTLKMNDTMAGVMGGPSKAEARKIIKKLTGKSVKEQKLREYIREAVRKALTEAHDEEDLIEAKKKGHGRRKIGSKKRRAIKKRRDARKLRR